MKSRVAPMNCHCHCRRRCCDRPTPQRFHLHRLRLCCRYRRHRRRRRRMPASCNAAWRTDAAPPMMNAATRKAETLTVPNPYKLNDAPTDCILLRFQPPLIHPAETAKPPNDIHRLRCHFPVAAAVAEATATSPMRNDRPNG